MKCSRKMEKVAGKWERRQENWTRGKRVGKDAWKGKSKQDKEKETGQWKRRQDMKKDTGQCKRRPENGSKVEREMKTRELKANCQWQAATNLKGPTHAISYDVAVADEKLVGILLSFDRRAMEILFKGGLDSGAIFAELIVGRRPVFRWWLRSHRRAFFQQWLAFHTQLGEMTVHNRGCKREGQMAFIYNEGNSRSRSIDVDIDTEL